MRYVLHRLQYANRDLTRIGPLDMLLVGRAHVVSLSAKSSTGGEPAL